MPFGLNILKNILWNSVCPVGSWYIKIIFGHVTPIQSHTIKSYLCHVITL